MYIYTYVCMCVCVCLYIHCMETGEWQNDMRHGLGRLVWAGRNSEKSARFSIYYV